MGRNRNRNRSPRQKQDGGSNRQSYALVSKTNEAFESYYKKQNLVPEGEWEDFLAALRKPLPSTFRITGFRSQARQLLNIIKTQFFNKLFSTEIDGRTVEPPKCLPWYPDELAWQLDMDRKFIRQSESLKRLHAFLIEETESGNISRQEAVSMIPPLVLDIQSHHKVLDMCAAPGSKTAQLLEMLHADDTKVVPEGCVVANDSDNKRCYMMTHQVKRLETPSFMIINQDASCMPNFKLPNTEGYMKSVKFDRILADVPCSGDGTLRKNVDAWAKWHVHTGMHLHNIQSRILSRGLEMLEVGGRLVYSTCSLNPMEDEAVIANMLRKSQGAVRLVDVSDRLPGLKSVSGVSSWKVISRDLEEFSCLEDVPEWLKSTMRPSVFPPSAEEAQTFQLHKCLRILPHLQNTGGFFIGVLEKTDELPWVKHVWVPAPEESIEIKEGENSESATTEGDQKPESKSSDKRHREHSPVQQRKKRKFGYKEDPFIFINEEDSIWPPVKEFYGLEKFPADQLLVRCMEGKRRNIYFTSAIIKSLVKHNEDRMKIINLGLKVLSRSDSQYVSCPFRTVQDGILVLYPHVTKRVVTLTKEDVVTLLSTEMPFLSRFSKSMQEQLASLDQGSVVFVFNPDTDDRPDSPKCRMVLCGWLGKTSCRSFIPLNDRGHYLRICGTELQPKAKRQKAEGGTQKEDSVEAEADTESMESEAGQVKKGPVKEGPDETGRDKQGLDEGSGDSESVSVAIEDSVLPPAGQGQVAPLRDETQKLTDDANLNSVEIANDVS